MNFDQGEFDFNPSGDEAGYRRWQERLDQQRRDFERRWGIPLGHRVRVQLEHHAKPLVGRVEAIQARSAKPRLRLGTVEFSPDQIESVVRED